MAIRSILFGAAGPPAGLEATPEPDHFHDLNLDQVVAAIIERADDPALAPYFRLPLRDPELVGFRQEVFADLEDPAVLAVVEPFTAAMRRMRRRLDLLARLRHAPQRHRWFLELVLSHADAVSALADGLKAVTLTSPGLRAARDDLERHIRSPRFGALRKQAEVLRERLGAVRYDMLLRGDQISLGRHDPKVEADYGARVSATFERFRRSIPLDYRKDLSADLGLDPVEVGILDLVVKLHPAVFADVAAFAAAEQRDFVTADVVRLDRELRFYLGYLSYLAPLRAAGLPLSLPAVSDTDKDLAARDVFDLALAATLTERGEPVVLNDLYLTGGERTLVVSGPNQGGKTTLSRTFGQLYYLAALGCPVPGRDVRVYLPDRILTHYEREENLDTLAGKLEEELRRMHAIMARATPDSVIILNEIFTSTTLQDARALSQEVLGVITDLDALCLWVSFVDELSRTNDKTVSMVSEMADDSVTTRTYKLVRRPADGRAYALALAAKHGLTYQRLKNRVRG